MKTIYVRENSVTINKETCSFYEAGLYDLGSMELKEFDIFRDKDIIEEHLLEREGEDSIIIFKTKRNVKIVGYGQEIELVLIDEFEEDFVVKYTHPSTGQECQEIEQIKTGWSFQDNQSNGNYQKLIDSIVSMESDGMVFEWCQDVEIVNIEDTPYGL